MKDLKIKAELQNLVLRIDCKVALPQITVVGTWTG